MVIVGYDRAATDRRKYWATRSLVGKLVITDKILEQLAFLNHSFMEPALMHVVISFPLSGQAFWVRSSLPHSRHGHSHVRSQRTSSQKRIRRHPGISRFQIQFVVGFFAVFRFRFVVAASFVVVVIATFLVHVFRCVHASL